MCFCLYFLFVPLDQGLALYVNFCPFCCPLTHLNKDDNSCIHEAWTAGEAKPGTSPGRRPHPCGAESRSMCEPPGRRGERRQERASRERVTAAGRACRWGPTAGGRQGVPGPRREDMPTGGIISLCWNFTDLLPSETRIPHFSAPSGLCFSQIQV